MILQRDIRTPPLQSERRLQGHRQEVCGLKWSTDHQLLASGGNDNKVLLSSRVYLLPCRSQWGSFHVAVWPLSFSVTAALFTHFSVGPAFSLLCGLLIRITELLLGTFTLLCDSLHAAMRPLSYAPCHHTVVFKTEKTRMFLPSRSTRFSLWWQLLVWNHSSVLPVQQYTEHLAAVKAIAWSPHQHGLLASGGGTADRCIRFWNTLTGQPLQCTDTGSQVCNLAWSKHTNELVRVLTNCLI